MELTNHAVMKPALRKLFQSNWKRCRIIFFSAPCGTGKTTVVQMLLEGLEVFSVSAAEPESFPEQLPSGYDVVLIDDFQLLKDVDRQHVLCEAIRNNPQLHFVILSRGVIPGWLMPFQLCGLLLQIDSSYMQFDRATTKLFLEKNGIQVSAHDLTQLQEDTNGYPLAVTLVQQRLSDGTVYSKEVYHSVQRDIFFYLEEAVFKRFPLPLRQLLLNVAPFEQFNPELAKMVSGDSYVNELLTTILHDTTMLLVDDVETYRFWPVFRRFLLWELNQTYTADEQNAIYLRAGLYYELREDYIHALDCYSSCGEMNKVAALLTKNAELHPGIGHYYEMEKYYDALPEQTILRSPALMCGMSMLTALNMDYEASERWYHELIVYASGLRRTDAEYREVQGRIAYLEIALPQRGSKGLVEILKQTFYIITDKGIQLPSFSVTSMLPSIMNGGKDFCEWSKKDDLLYATMRKPIELVLGADGIGLADCAICESKFEKGMDISERLLALVGRLNEIQRRGTADMEFAVIGLLVRAQTAQGHADSALRTLEDLRSSFAEAGSTRFLPNMDAMRCRLWLRLGRREDAAIWCREQAPSGGIRLRTMWRYRYLTKAMVQIANGDCMEALVILAQLRTYTERCARTMDHIHVRLLIAVCYYRRGREQWRRELAEVLDTVLEYQFIWPIAQYGAAVLPLLMECGWNKDKKFFEQLVMETRQQTVNYPDFMRPQVQIREALSPAELQVLKLLCHDRSNQEIGDILGIKVSTVKSHVTHILQKLGVSRRSEAKTAAEALHLF